MNLLDKRGSWRPASPYLAFPRVLFAGDPKEAEVGEISPGLGRLNRTKPWASLLKARVA